MKNRIILTFVAFLFCLPAFSQTVEERAIGLTDEMAEQINLTIREKKQVLQYNIQKLKQIDKLATLREQDPRYLDLRLDEIEELYNSQIFNLLSNKKYLSFVDFRKTQPSSYAALVKSKYMVAAAEDE